MTLTPADLQALMAAFDASEWDEMTLVLDDANIQLSKTGQPPATAAAGIQPPTPGGRTANLSRSGGARLPAATAAGAVGTPADVAPVPAVEAAERSSELLLEHASGVHRVTSPSVGVFWRAPDPAAPPFVEVGQRVDAEDPVCIVEVMKLFNHVQAGAGGVVRSVEVENGAMVEHGQTLFLIGLDG
ncbi:MAG: acetyl-CoA carboxylase biotin carboxyl carrier protein subunit [Actinomycetota bacterium]|nr:acetyl-CoA carboxylase biotin carboxyl carrier protein subunit [Actinomycetota bacterium]